MKGHTIGCWISLKYRIAVIDLTEKINRPMDPFVAISAYTSKGLSSITSYFGKGPHKV